MGGGGYLRSLYVCGVGVGPTNLLFQKNFHLPLKPEPGAREIRQTYNGYRVSVENAIAMPIPDLEPGWKGLDRANDPRTSASRSHSFGWIDRPHGI